ncbi:MAG: rhomboid family intramembrane serine protease [Bacteroidetes bacterium]|nr:MAG: rhomboid family intramembrane serine protease [Bacteroidota bacterium]
MQLTPAVKVLLIINVAVFLLANVVDANALALYYFESDNFRPWQILTHFFMHANLPHLFFNMFALVMFGAVLERLWGTRRFVFYYFFSALGAAVLHTFVQWLHFHELAQAMDAFRQTPALGYFNDFFEAIDLDMYKPQLREVMYSLATGVEDGLPDAIAQAQQVMQQVYEVEMNNSAVVGASGAIFGLLIAFGILFPEAELMLIFLPIPIKAKYFIPLLMMVELFLGVNHFSWDNIAHFAHLGGALFGLLLLIYWRRQGRW